MEELSIEEKAQRYDEAIERARRYYNEYKTRDNILYVEDMEDMFPELKESDSEKIKKELIDFVKSRLAGFPERDKFIAWLEKQGEQITITDEELIKARNEAYNDALDKLEYHSDTPTFNDGWSAAIWYLKREILNKEPNNYE